MALDIAMDAFVPSNACNNSFGYATHRWFLELPGGSLADDHRDTVERRVSNAMHLAIEAIKGTEFVVWDDTLLYARLLNVIDLNWDVLRTEWIIPNGDIAGTFPKRLRTYLLRKGREHDMLDYVKKIPAEFYARIGAELGPEVNSGVTYCCDIVRRVRWERGDFGDDNSCFWGERRNDRIQMVEDDRFRAFRIWRYVDHYWRGKGRCWMIQTDRRSDQWALFNAYGINLVTCARLLCHVTGYTYKRVTIVDDNVYINDDSGWIISAVPYDRDRVDLNIPYEKECCENCGSTCHDTDDCDVCRACGSDDCGWCDRCEAPSCECECCENCHRRECICCDSCNRPIEGNCERHCGHRRHCECCVDCQCDPCECDVCPACERSESECNSNMIWTVDGSRWCVLTDESTDYRAMYQATVENVASVFRAVACGILQNMNRAPNTTRYYTWDDGVWIINDCTCDQCDTERFTNYGRRNPHVTNAA